MTGVALLCFAVLGSIDPVALALGALATAAATVAAGRVRLGAAAASGGRVLDVAVVVAVLLLVPDLVSSGPRRRRPT